MEFGVMSSNGVIVPGNGYSSFSSDHALKRKWCGSADFLKKQQMSEFSHDNEDFKPTNLAKLSNDSSFVFSDNQQEQNMLSFSSLPKLDAFSPKTNGGLENKNLLQNPTSFPYFQHSNSSYSKNAGYSCNGNLNASMYFTNGFKGPFTASQWFELEQQALIYKFILANEPIPPSLLISIRRAFESARFSSFPGGLLRPNMFGWGPFHLGFASSTDPEAGRCRRTDGKKWRCSRDAVPDQKYCERHINRGRHRSRKPVEGLTGHSVSGATSNRSSNTNTTTSVMNNGSSSSALVVPRGSPSNSAAINLDQSKDTQLQPVPSNHLPSSLAQRLMVNKASSSQRMQSTKGLDTLSPKNCLNSTDSTAGDFPFLTSNAILSTTHRGSSVSRTYAQSHDLNVEHSSQPVMEDPSRILWPKLQTQTNRTTKLSISIPPADFMSSTSSPTGEKVALSPLRLSRELDRAPVGMDTVMCMGMGFGLDTVSNDQSLISWENSMGGPLGEVLKTTTSNSSGGQSKSISSLNLLSKGSEGSPQMASSPTGVLQRTAMMSYYSNSSSGSSPQAENEKTYKSGTVNGDLIGFTLGSSSSLPL